MNNTAVVTGNRINNMNLNIISMAENKMDADKVWLMNNYCGKCQACLKKDNCGKCRFCKDNPKFGGPNILKRKCMDKVCVKAIKEYQGELHAESSIKRKTMRTGKILLVKRMRTAPTDISKMYKCVKSGCGFVTNTVERMFSHKQTCDSKHEVNVNVTPVAKTAPVLNPPGLTPMVTEEDDRQCVLCPEIVADKLSMKKHILDHYKEYLLPLMPRNFHLYAKTPYKCSYCNADLQNEQNLLWHYAFTHNHIMMYTNEHELEGKVVKRGTKSHTGGETNSKKDSNIGSTVEASSVPVGSELTTRSEYPPSEDPPTQTPPLLDTTSSGKTNTAPLNSTVPGTLKFQVPGSDGSVQKFPVELKMPEVATLSKQPLTQILKPEFVAVPRANTDLDVAADSNIDKGPVGDIENSEPHVSITCSKHEECSYAGFCDGNKCKYCGEEFLKSDEFIKHLQAEPKRQCLLCPMETKTKKQKAKNYTSIEMRNHVLLHYSAHLTPSLPNERPYRCPDCGIDQGKRSKLLEHYAFVHKNILMYSNERELQGRLVWKGVPCTYGSSGLMATEAHGTGKMYNYNKCGISSARKSHLKVDMAEIVGPSEGVADNVSKKYLEDEIKAIENQSKTESEKGKYCESIPCLEPKSTWLIGGAHKKCRNDAYLDNGGYKCPFCSKKFSERGSFLMHIQGTSKRQCVICPKVIENKNNMRDHILTHYKAKLIVSLPSNKLLVCPDCGEEFGSNATILLRHYAFDHNHIEQYTNHYELEGKLVIKGVHCESGNEPVDDQKRYKCAMSDRSYIANSPDEIKSHCATSHDANKAQQRNSEVTDKNSMNSKRYKCAKPGCGFVSKSIEDMVVHKKSCAINQAPTQLPGGNAEMPKENAKESSPAIMQPLTVGNLSNAVINQEKEQLENLVIPRRRGDQFECTVCIFSSTSFPVVRDHVIDCHWPFAVWSKMELQAVNSLVISSKRKSTVTCSICKCSYSDTAISLRDLRNHIQEKHPDKVQDALRSIKDSLTFPPVDHSNDPSNQLTVKVTIPILDETEKSLNLKKAKDDDTVVEEKVDLHDPDPSPIQPLSTLSKLTNQDPTTDPVPVVKSTKPKQVCERRDYKDFHSLPGKLTGWAFKCNICEHVTAKKANMETHLKAVHYKIKDYKCTLCTYATSRHNYLTKHMKEKHGKIISSNKPGPKKGAGSKTKEFDCNKEQEISIDTTESKQVLLKSDNFVKSPISPSEQSNISSNEVDRLMQSLTPLPEHEIQPIVQELELPQQQTQLPCEDVNSIKSDCSDSGMNEFTSEEKNVEQTSLSVSDSNTGMTCETREFAFDEL